MRTIERLSREQAQRFMPKLIDLLQDALQGGASMGFIAPLSTAAAEEYWIKALEEVAGGQRILIVSKESNSITGSVQLALADKQNGLHRAKHREVVSPHAISKSRDCAGVAKRS